MHPAVFLSWSLAASKGIAQRLEALLRKVLQDVAVYLSTSQMKGGAVFYPELLQALSLCRIGVAIVTPENKHRPWLHFEAGAIAHAVTKGKRLVVLRCGVELGELADTPFASIHQLELSRAGLLDLIKVIHEDTASIVPASEIEENFETWLAKLGDDWLTLPEMQEPREPRAITVQDIAAQIEQVRALLLSMQANLSPGALIAAGITGQGELATMSRRDLIAIIEAAIRDRVIRPGERDIVEMFLSLYDKDKSRSDTGTPPPETRGP